MRYKSGITTGVRNIMPYVRNYASFITKGNEYSVVDNNYPSILYGIVSKSSGADIYYKNTPGISVRPVKTFSLDVGRNGFHIRTIMGELFKIKELYSFATWICKLENRGWKKRGWWWYWDLKAHYCTKKISWGKYDVDQKILVYDNDFDTEDHGRPYWEDVSAGYNAFGFPYLIKKILGL